MFSKIFNRMRGEFEMNEILSNEMSIMTIDEKKFPKYLAAPVRGVGCKGSSCSGSCT